VALFVFSDDSLHPKRLALPGSPHGPGFFLEATPSTGMRRGSLAMAVPTSNQRDLTPITASDGQRDTLSDEPADALTVRVGSKLALLRDQPPTAFADRIDSELAPAGN
jgi:hypothetical protein